MLGNKSLLDVFKKQEDPKEVVRRCQRMIRTEIRGVERQQMGALRGEGRLLEPARCRRSLPSCCAAACLPTCRRAALAGAAA